MAWIAVAHETPFKDEIIQIAKRLKVSRREAFAMVVEFWIYVDAHVDASASLGSRDMLDLTEGTRLLEPFFEAMISVGWLGKDGECFTIPNAEDWLSRSAKSRLQKNKRQQKWRAGKNPVDGSVDDRVDAAVDAPPSLQNRTEQNNTKNNNTPPPPKGGKAPRFIPPTLNEVRDYCTERGNRVDPETFRDFYEAKGWKVGAQPMKDWRAAVRTWEKSEEKRGGGRVLSFKGLEGDFDNGSL